MATNRICEVEGCDNKRQAKGYCWKHYTRWRTHGDPHKCRKPKVGCLVDGCDEKHHARGYCARHNYKFVTHGDPLGGRRGSSPGEPIQWIKDHASYDGDDCIKWPYEVTRHGYGTIKQKGKKRVASRVMCEIAHGLPPEPSMEAAHECGNGQKGCMNPNHLSWKTRKGNMRDAQRHGTWNHGEKVPQSKLTRDQVLEIRSMKGKMRQKDLAPMFNISPTTISKIWSGQAWAWLE